MLLAVGTLLAAGCGGTGVEPSALNPAAVPDISGTYTLVSLNGQGMPVPLPDGPVLTGGSFRIGKDGTCTSTTWFTVPSGAQSSRDVSGSYVQEGFKLTMSWTGAGKTLGTVEGSVFTMDNEGMIFVYRKQ